MAGLYDRVCQWKWPGAGSIEMQAYAEMRWFHATPAIGWKAMKYGRNLYGVRL